MIYYYKLKKLGARLIQFNLRVHSFRNTRIHKTVSVSKRQNKILPILTNLKYPKRTPILTFNRPFSFHSSPDRLINGTLFCSFRKSYWCKKDNTATSVCSYSGIALKQCTLIVANTTQTTSERSIPSLSDLTDFSKKTNVVCQLLRLEM